MELASKWRLEERNDGSSSVLCGGCRGHEDFDSGKGTLRSQLEAEDHQPETMKVYRWGDWKKRPTRRKLNEPIEFGDSFVQLLEAGMISSAWCCSGVVGEYFVMMYTSERKEGSKSQCVGRRK